MARNFQIVPAKLEHAQDLAPRMRAEDAAEVLASGGYTPIEALLASLKGSPYAGTLLVDGKVAAMFGVMPMPNQHWIGVAWLLTSDLVAKRPRPFLCACRQAIREMVWKYPVLINAVDARYRTALRWASWLGFEIAAPIPFGVAKLPFHPIRLRRKDVVHV